MTLASVGYRRLLSKAGKHSEERAQKLWNDIPSVGKSRAVAITPLTATSASNSKVTAFTALVFILRKVSSADGARDLNRCNWGQRESDARVYHLQPTYGTIRCSIQGKLLIDNRCFSLFLSLSLGFFKEGRGSPPPHLAPLPIVMGELCVCSALCTRRVSKNLHCQCVGDDRAHVLFGMRSNERVAIAPSFAPGVAPPALGAFNHAQLSYKSRVWWYSSFFDRC